MTQIIHKTEFDQMERWYRARFINALTGAKGAHLVGSTNDQGVLNLTLFSSVFHLGADPAMIGMISRPNTVPRHTLENIKQTGVFTLNHFHQDMIDQAHLSSARTDESEFDLTGLTAEFQSGFQAPFVKESKLKIALSLCRVIDIEENGTHMILGNIESVQFPEDALLETGDFDFDELGSVCVTGLNTYHETKTIKTLPYARSR